MRRRRVALAGLMVAAVLAGGCAAVEPARPSAQPSPAPYRTDPMIVAVSSDGVVVADPGSGSYRGYSSRGELRWTDREAYRQDADAVCAARCPDAVLSAPAGDVPTWRRPMGRATLVGGAGKRVLSVRGPSDAVLAESAPGKGGWLTLLRNGVKRTRVPISSAAGLLWVEDPARSAALIAYDDPDVAGADIRWFRRDRHGWRPTGRTAPAAGVWGACLADGGDLTVLTGPGARMLVNGRTVPLRTDLRVAAECAAGRDGAVVLDRWVDERGVRHTAVRGVGVDGRQIWARELATEATVAADPDGRRFALVHDGTAEIVDARGRTTSRFGGVVAAAFPRKGELVTLDAGARPRRLTLG
ncbi:hypothetical protein [Nonomuraea sp. B19D2]|uniref:hypothetical protein n=1 Tax=Nonomuraea sp. B19D2 TaxID=3159561 RepID=UPI0032DB5C9D